MADPAVASKIGQMEVSLEALQIGDSKARPSSYSSVSQDDLDIHKRFVVTLQGPNSPGVLSPIMDIMERPEHQICLRDMAQYVIEETLVVSMLIEHGTESSIAFIKELVTTSRQNKLDMDFSFSRTLDTQEYASYMVLAITLICCSGPIPATLLHSLFSYLGEQGIKIVEIVHHRDDRIANNNECSKIRMRVRCPQQVGISQLFPHLQKMAWQHQSEVTVREWEGMERPNGKSLVLFGLSDVLCPYDVLDKVLEEADVDPASIPKVFTNQEPDRVGSANARVKALKGKNASCMQRAADNLKFTPGAYLVCQSLKDLGFKLALLSNTGCKLVVQKVKQELGLDYAISRDLEVEGGVFTGQYTGDDKDVPFHKVDYLQLMAEKEGVHPRNVIIVGTFTNGMSNESVRYVLDTYGPMVYFHFSKMPSGTLTTMLYLLGFTGCDLEELRSHKKKRMGARRLTAKLPNVGGEAIAEGGATSTARPVLRSCSSNLNMVDNSPKSPADPDSYFPKDSRRYLVCVRSEKNDVERFAALLLPLLPHYKARHCLVRRMQQVTLASENTLLGLELALSGPDPVAPLRDLLFESHRLGLTVSWDEKDGEQAQPPDNQRYIATVVERPQLALSTLASVFRVCRDLAIDLVRLERLSEDHSFSALQITALVPPTVEGTLRARLLAISKECEVDIAFQRDGIERWARRLVVFDMDSTLIQQEVVDVSAILVGKEKECQEITDRAFRGELDFHESLQLRMALLADQSAVDLYQQINGQLTYTPGARELCWILKHLGYKMAVISGGFLAVARQVQKDLGLDYAFANTLEIRQTDGMLTGNTVGPVVTPQRKRALLAMIAQVEGCDMRQTIAVGDGSNDIPMLTSAGLGIAFCAKPKVQATADVRVNNKDLQTVLYLIGVSENAQRRLLVRDASADDQGLKSASEACSRIASPALTASGSPKFSSKDFPESMSSLRV